MMVSRMVLMAAGMVLALVLIFAASAVTSATDAPAGGGGPALAHMVFFTLKDHSKESRDAFVASCHKYLANHEGVRYFSIGEIAQDVEEPVSVRDFDVALHLVFENKAAEFTYQKSERHTQFVAENKAKFEKVRVFDSYIR